MRKYFSIHYHNVEVECLNDALVYLVTWLFGGLYGISTKLPVVVSVYLLLLAFVARGPLRKILGLVRSTEEK